MYLPEAVMKKENYSFKMVIHQKIAKDAIYIVGGKIFSIPPRSLELNPIENVFNNVKSQIREQAIERYLTRENFEQFSQRIKSTLENYPIEVIDKTISSMNKHIDLVIKAKGEHIRY